MSEKVLCIPTEVIVDRKGFVPCQTEYIDQEILNPDRIKFIEREQAETDETHVQIIPYCLLLKQGKLFSYRRGSGGGEARLHKKRSIGLGGHINHTDINFMPEVSYYHGKDRELREEVGYEQVMGIMDAIVGTIYDPSNEVGRVHLGIVHIIALYPRCELKIEEDDLEHSKFVTPDDLIKTANEYENWSKLLIDSYLLTPQETPDQT